MLRFILTIFLFQFVLVLFSQSEEVQKELKIADRYMIEQNYQLALEHINIALNIEALNLNALEKKANVMFLLGTDKELMKEITGSIEVYPQQPEYHYVKAMLFLYRQKYKSAIEFFDNAEYYQLPQDHAEKIFANRGTAYYYYGDFVKAEQDFRQAIELNPRNVTAYHSWGMLKYEENLYEEAISYFNKTIQYQENNKIAYYNLGMAHYKIGELKDACYNFNRSCNLGNMNGCKIYILECTE